MKPNLRQILRLERSLVMNAFAEAEGIKLDEDRLKTTLDEVMGELIADGNMNEIRKEMGNKQFTNAIAMESANRLMNTEIHTRLKLIATGEMAKEKQEKEIEAQTKEKVKKTAAKKKPVSSKPASKTSTSKKKSPKPDASKSAKSKTTSSKTTTAKSTKAKTSTAKSAEAKKKKPASAPEAEIREKKEMADLPQSSDKEDQKKLN